METNLSEQLIDNYAKQALLLLKQSDLKLDQLEIVVRELRALVNLEEPWIE